MLTFPQPPREYGHVYLDDTDKPLPEVLNPNMRYLFMGEIAKGGKCVIQSCRDLHLSRIVCYKSLRSEFVGNEIEERRLLREARVSAMLQHPNTVPVYEVGRERNGSYYFTMKMVHGYTLREIFDYRERYDLTQLVEVIVQIAQALAYAHIHGVAHRDVKPENILVGPYGEVVLLDWGLAKVWSKQAQQTLGEEDGQEAKDSGDDAITLSGKIEGTLCYMSPEQVRRDPGIDFSTDIYSLGSVLYELLAGQTPFDGDQTHEILDAVQQQTPPDPSDVSPYRVPQTLEALCMKCLQKNPEDRPRNMEEVIQVLQQDWAWELLSHKPD